MVNVSFTGSRALQKAIDGITGPQVKKAMSKGLRAGGKITLARVRAIAPKDTGDLRKAIVLRAGKRDRKGTKSVVIMVDAKKVADIKSVSGLVGVHSQRYKSGKGKLGEEYYYPAAQEFGWTKGGAYFPGTPHFRPGFDQTVEQANAVTEQTIWRRIMVEWAKPKG